MNEQIIAKNININVEALFSMKKKLPLMHEVQNQDSTIENNHKK